MREISRHYEVVVWAKEVDTPKIKSDGRLRFLGAACTKEKRGWMRRLENTDADQDVSERGGGRRFCGKHGELIVATMRPKGLAVFFGLC